MLGEQDDTAAIPSEWLETKAVNVVIPRGGGIPLQAGINICTVGHESKVRTMVGLYTFRGEDMALAMVIAPDGARALAQDLLRVADEAERRGEVDRG